MRFSLATLAIAVMSVAVVLSIVAAVARERTLRQREMDVKEQLRRLYSWSRPQPPIYEDSTCFDVAPGLPSLMLHSVRTRMGTRTVCYVRMPYGPVPGDILAQCSNLQFVDLRIPHPHMDLSELSKIRQLRQLSLWGEWPDDFEPLTRIPVLESVQLNFLEGNNEPDGDFLRFAVAKKLKRVSSSRVSDPVFAPLERALPDCRLRWLPPPY